MSNWIKCSEQLPETNLDMLVSDGTWQAVAYWTRGEWNAANVDCGANFRINIDFIPTHWQRLPTPPEE